MTHHLFEKTTSLENLFLCWDQFKRGKHKRKDIQYFERYLEDFIFVLRNELVSSSYKHGSYKKFYVFDPKERHISRAAVKDRLVHQAVYTTLTEIFDNTFIFHSFSCRLGKGAHSGIEHLQKILRQVSCNNTRPCFVLKMDILRFFDSIDHKILKSLIRKRIKEGKFLRLTEHIIDSFEIKKKSRKTGLPLGNVTSQIFANIYLNELDNFIKQKLRKKNYLRYCDDFVIVSNCETELKELIPSIQKFLNDKLFLNLHPKKIILRKLSQGVDFLGYILFFNHRLLRTRTKQRMHKRLRENHYKYLNCKIESSHMEQCLQSYLGMLSHANHYDLAQALKNAYWIREE